MKVLKIIGFIGGIGLLTQTVAAPYELEENELPKTDHRFQIFIAEHNALLNGKSITMKSIFKIDLETGTVWRYRQGVDSKGKPFEEFFEVPNQ
ncbi:MAG: hypothetical protein AMJ53_08345 [Gammaproteobacteria bacterium SG8_11]|nr:MAG: hypothetical protein AMJ53_08345 [Gammaproteobacteria bacterium SG8_11]